LGAQSPRAGPVNVTRRKLGLSFRSRETRTTNVR
jgi:hypothetical protein